MLEERFGFNKTSKKLFIRDFIVSTILSLFIVILLFKSFEYLYHMSTDFWWLYVWLLFIFVNLLTAYIFPTLIAPIFNKFEKLDDNKLDVIDDDQIYDANLFMMRTGVRLVGALGI